MGRSERGGAAVRRLKPRVLVNRDKPGRRIEFVQLAQVERALGKRIRHVYHNTIRSGAVAGDHWHKRHAVAVDVRRGKLEFVLEHVDSRRSWKGTVRAGEPMLLVPARVYHAARNPGPGPAVATMYATTPPRGADDEFEHVPRVRVPPAFFKAGRPKARR